MYEVRYLVGVYTFRACEGGKAHWWAGPFPDYERGWSRARWPLIESVDGLEFV